MLDSTSNVEKAFGIKERELGLHNLRLGCAIAALLTPPGALIDMLLFVGAQKAAETAQVANSAVGLLALFGFRVLCSVGVVPILILSYKPFAAKHFRLMGVILAFAPAFCMAGIIAVTQGIGSGYYVGLILVLLGVGVVMHWTYRQTLVAAVMVLVMYLVATLVMHEFLWRHIAQMSPPVNLSGRSAFLTGDLGDGSLILPKLLRREDPVVAEVRASFPALDETLGRLASRDIADAESALTALADGLNRVVTSGKLISRDALGDRTLRDETMKMLGILEVRGATALTDSEKSKLNRLLLEDAFPEGLRRMDTGNHMPTLAAHLWFLLLTSVIIVIGNHSSSKLRYSDFVKQHKLDQSRKEAEHTSERLEEANRRLRELDQLKDDFFANVSHELRTPLTLLLGPVEHLQRHPMVIGDERLKDFVTTMHDNGMRLLKLINDLLDLVRLQAKALVLKPSPISVATYAGKLIASIRGYAEDRGLKLVWNVHPDLGTVEWDEAKIDKVFLNLLFNAIKFTPAGGEVSWHAWRDGDEALIEVRDTGVGISAENQKFLFQRFWQADSSSHRKHQGAGIGLALVKELVEAHGGGVSVRSKLGQGTTMVVRLPLVCVVGGGAGAGSVRPASPKVPTRGTEPVVSAPPTVVSGVSFEHGSANGNGNGSVNRGDAGANPGGAVGVGDLTQSPGEQEAAAARLETQKHLDALYRRAELHASITPLRQALRPWSPVSGNTKNRPQVLVVDDEPGIRRFLRDRLAEDYTVHEAVDGQQGLELAKQYMPDAVVCDMMLPEKDGMEVCRELRGYHSTRMIPFLMLTARADDETKLMALAAGASDFLVKPFRTEELKLRIKNLVDARRLERELGLQNRKLQSTLQELKETESRLVQSEKMGALGRLVAGIIHEINNPLNFARTGIHVLTRHGKALPEAKQAEFLEVIKDISDGITRVSGIVGELRQFSHPDNDALHEVDVAGSVAAALRFMAAEYKDGKVEVVNEIPPGFLVRGNKNKLVQVFINMFQNAFDAMKSYPPAEGQARLQLRAWEEKGSRRVSIRDNGPGISDEHVQHIFEPFFTTKEVGKGMGLGLSICFRILEEAGGRILINTEKGRYCEFVLEFPNPS